MDDVSTYLSINRTLFRICCIFWIVSPAEGNVIAKVVGSQVTLACNTSNITVQQLTWQLNSVTLISYRPEDMALFTSEEATNLKINMPLSGTELYSLVIDGVQRSHAGNYSCDIAALEGVRIHEWELVITEKKEGGKWRKQMHVIAVATTVLCVCCLIFIFTFTILRRVSDCRAEDNSEPAPVTQEQTGDVYENCLEINVDRHRSCQPAHYKPRAHQR
ncbi:uncharacterized protein LOC117755325 isoform X1 [Hippoglossus hippoglossus]|uniref:uncharacterized protein LOC117755325 isoform X1 n=1 Tax=Hippoglossus hippoglossus TaxID=8267 RepID=UPI00148E7C41|nr:uncharacterized protein LOC117755325 isoform X1 [Hippoglossus hippoglossus]